MKRPAIAYLRVSTREQGDSRLGLSAQLTSCKAFCDGNGYDLVEYRSEVISGTVPLTERPIFLEARNLCMKWQAILVVAKQDRISRDELIWHGLCSKHTFGKIGTPELIIVESPHATPFELSIRAAVSAEERRLISERTKRALAEKKKQGVSIGQVGRAAAHAKLIDTSEAYQIIIFMKSEGFNSSMIANYLNERGYTNAYGRPWQGKSINAMLCKLRKKNSLTND